MITDLVLYIYNAFNANVTVDAEDVSVNGFMMDTFLYDAVGPGMRRVTSIPFDDEDLAANGIETVENSELTVYARDDA